MYLKSRNIYTKSISLNQFQFTIKMAAKYIIVIWRLCKYTGVVGGASQGGYIAELTELMEQPFGEVGSTGDKSVRT